MTAWTEQDIPSQRGRIAVITGTGGLGYETARVLAAHGAEIALAGRNEAKGRASVEAIRALHPAAKINFFQLDLASLGSIAAFARSFSASHSSIDLLINNAGVMTPPKRLSTKDGFELQFGTNYLGHFALTGHLLPLLLRGRSPRVVHVSSGAHHTGRIRFDDLQWESSYRPWLAYSQSKLANLMFALELQRRSDANGWGLVSNAAHPGYARTELIPNGPGNNRFFWTLNRMLLQPWMSQSPAEGALPTLFAATEGKQGGYYGPSRLFELIGPPKPARIAKKAKDETTALRLWEVSEQLTGVAIPARTIADDITGISKAS